MGDRRWVLGAVRPLLLTTPTATRTWLGTPARPAEYYPQFSAITLRADGIVAEMMVPPIPPSLIPGGLLADSTPDLLMDVTSPLSHAPPYAVSVLGRLRDQQRTRCSVMFASGRLVHVTLAPVRHGSLLLGSRGPDADLARALLCWMRWDRDSVCVQRLIALASGYLHLPSGHLLVGGWHLSCPPPGTLVVFLSRLGFRPPMRGFIRGTLSSGRVLFQICAPSQADTVLSDLQGLLHALTGRPRGGLRVVGRPFGDASPQLTVLSWPVLEWEIPVLADSPFISPDMPVST